jgi:hypothetical protein
MLHAVACTQYCENRQRGYQIRTILRMKDWAVALDKYHIDNGHFPKISRLVVPRTVASTNPNRLASSVFADLVDAWPVTPQHRLTEAKQYLCRIYLPVEFDTTDEWGDELLLGITSDLEGFTLVSLGSDGRLDTKPAPCCFEANEAYRDIVYSASPGVFGFASAPSGITH